MQPWLSYAPYIVAGLLMFLNGAWAILNLRSQNRQAREHADLKEWIHAEFTAQRRDIEEWGVGTFATIPEITALSRRVYELEHA
jgi:hypothetical protein